MQYDPIKKVLGKVFNLTPWLRILFYHLLDLLLLRSWHVRREIHKFTNHIISSSAHQLTISSAHQLTNSPAHQLTSSSAHQLTNSPAHQLTSSSAHQLTISSAHQLTSSSAHQLQILDAGSGFGQYTWFLSSLMKQAYVTAIDVKEDQIADCQAFFQKMGKTNVSFETADMTTFVHHDSFHLILSVDVMEHIEEDEKVFRNFYESLTREGMLLISTPSDQGGSDVHDHEHETSFIDEHVRDGYNIMEIQEKLRRAGFNRIEVRYAYGYPGHIGWLLSMKYPIKMLHISKLFFLLLPFYYLFTFPLAFLFNLADLWTQHSKGTGLIVKAYK